MSERYNIGYLTAHKVISYPTGIQDGIRNGITEQGHNLINISDLISFGFIDTAPDLFRLSFELAARLDLDCVIVPSGIVNAYLRNNKNISVDRLLSLLDPAKTLVIEDKREGFRSIRKDNKPGMRELIRHLIEEHKYTKICFLSGPAESHGARERESVYFEEMKAHGIPVGEHMFARGIFSGACDDVVEELLFFNDEIEAIVCANDIMAATVYRILKKHGLTPGVDIAVTGFDDSPESQHATPPLSTVRSSTYDLGYAAAYEAVRICEGKEQKMFSLDSSFIHRASCGENDLGRGSKYGILLGKESISIEDLTEQMLVDIMKKSSADIREACHDRVQRIARKIVQICDESKPLDFEHIVDAVTMTDVFRHDYADYLSLENFQTAITDCILGARAQVSGERRMWIDAEHAFFHRLIANNIKDSYENRELKTAMRAWDVTKILADALMYADNSGSAVMHVLNDFKELGIKDAAILIFDDPVEYSNKSNFSMDDEIKVIGRINNGVASVNYLKKAATIRLQQVIQTFVPKEIREGERDMTSPCYTIAPLVTGKEMIGVMLIGPCMLMSSEIVRLYYQTGFGLKHINTVRMEMELISILNRNNLKLSVESEHDELTGLYNRRGFMRALERRLGDESTKSSMVKRGGLYYMDLDGLKQINDSFGHDEGDFALQSTAKILAEAFEGDMVARLGGDEFLAFKEFSGTQQASDMEGKIEEIMQAFNESSDKPFLLGISVGYKEFDIKEVVWKEIPVLLDEADALLYRNKRRRKGLTDQ